MKVHVKVALIFLQRFFDISLVRETKTAATSYCILRSVSVCKSFFFLVYEKNAEYSIVIFYEKRTPLKNTWKLG